jgi:hypothetical protein
VLCYYPSSPAIVSSLLLLASYILVCTYINRPVVWWWPATTGHDHRVPQGEEVPPGRGRPEPETDRAAAGAVARPSVAGLGNRWWPGSQELLDRVSWNGSPRKKRKNYTAASWDWEVHQQPPASLDLQLNHPLPLDWEQCLDLQVSTNTLCE